jgi:hypothetical protein
MPSPLKNRALAMVGLVGLLPLALGLLRGTLTVDAAGFRAGVLLGALMVIERFVLPFRSLLVEPRRSAREPGVPERRRND